MKNKSWIIILIMAIALSISIGYSIVVSKKNAEPKESTVTTKSIIEMTATTATIKNTLIGSGNIESIEISKNVEENKANEVAEENNEHQEQKIYQIKLLSTDKDLDKVKEDLDVEISVKDEENTLNYIGKVKKVEKDLIGKSTILVEIMNPDENIKDGITANCTVIVEKAENVVALPIEAIQKNDDGKEFVDVVQVDGSTEPVLIVTGLSDDYYVEITNGIKAGDRVQIIKSMTTTIIKEENDKNKNETSR